MEILIRGRDLVHRVELAQRPGFVGTPFRLGYEVIHTALVATSRLWYAHRALRPLLLLPGWTMVALAQIYLWIMPIAAAYPEHGDGKLAKKWAASFTDNWPLSSYYEDFLALPHRTQSHESLGRGATPFGGQ